MQISQQDVFEFAKWSADCNPAHVELDASSKLACGGTIVHGALTTIACLRWANVELPRVPRIASLEIEFRTEIRPDHDYLVQSNFVATTEPSDVNGSTTKDMPTSFLDVVVKDEQSSSDLIQIRAGLGPNGSPMPNGDSWYWVESACNDGIRSSLEDQPVDWQAEDFRRGKSVVGVHQFGPHSPREDSPLTCMQEKALGLCSFIVGMKSPGLSSLFTRLQLRFGEVDSHEDQLAYRLTFKDFDPHFRLLETELEIATLDGRMIAIAEIQSYVRFTQSTPNPEKFVGRLSVQTADLDGKVALICGASRGLGAELACALGETKTRVYLGCRNQTESVESLAQRIRDHGGTAEIVVGDVGDLQWCAATCNLIQEREGRLGLLILNACAPPVYTRIADADPKRSMAYVSENLALAQAPLFSFLPLLSRSAGTVVGISSSFVNDSPAGFSDYIAVKMGMEGSLKTAAREHDQVQFIVARPPKMRTRWNDTPTTAMGAIPALAVAIPIINAIAESSPSSNYRVVSEFPYEEAVSANAADPDWKLVLVSSFTLDPIRSGFQLWSRELGLNIVEEFAPYGQILQQSLDPTSQMSQSPDGSVVLLRMSDWLRERSTEMGTTDDTLKWLRETAREHIEAFKTHRSHASGHTLLLICPSSPVTGLSDHLVTELEAMIHAGLSHVPGLTMIDARDFHQSYEVPDDSIADPLREEIAHIPFSEGYYQFLTTLIVRFFHQRMSSPKKVVVLDCDNTLWRGIVGEAGAEGIEFDEVHHRLHKKLSQLSAAGILICLCSKNEEHDVWSVFDQRDEFGLSKDQVVASAINWLPKSQNIQSIAENLNLGLNSFVFLDDNPVECAEVRAGCPEVLTLQWPQQSTNAGRLLDHLWELDVFSTTADDKKRTQRYREEFDRQKSRQQSTNFRSFIESLQLKIDIRPLDDDDLARASQLTMRTNQFNFTTIRRTESELRELMNDSQYQCNTIRVSDRFGDYGLTGLFIARAMDEHLLVDTFLLSCRVLGRGAEHDMAARLGQLAVERNLSIVLWKHEPTERNTPARMFLSQIANDSLPEDSTFACEFNADAAELAQFEFETNAAAIEESPQESKSALPKEDSAPRAREQQIHRTSSEFATYSQLSAVRGSSGSVDSSPVETEDLDSIAETVKATFARSLGTTIDRISQVDRLDALGCDSLRIVEITIVLTRRFPWLPKTLLFEHRSVSDIVDQITRLASGATAVDVQSGIGFTSTRSPDAKSDDLAIVGIGVHCAGSKSALELWDQLAAGRSAIKKVPIRRAGSVGQLKDDRDHFAGIIADADKFDPEFFGISPREAEYMDPQLRLLLQTSWHALEDSGNCGNRFDADTGVFVGVMYAGYARFANEIATHTGSVYRCWEGFSLANRLSQVLGSRGPSLSIDTACSASATALHYACQSLRNGDCNTAVVGGVNLIVDPSRLVQQGRLGILSPSGRCVPFGDLADGTVMGEGVVSVVLRPLSEAIKQGDRVYAVIKGTGISSGAGSVGFTAPNPNAQAVAARRAIAAAGVDPRTITYIETHGTGTELGDPIEVRGLEMAYCDQSGWDSELKLEHQCGIGSIKPNVGHLEAGAGLMGVVKAALQLHYRALVPSLTSVHPNPQIPFEQLPFKIQVAQTNWVRPTAIKNGVQVELPLRAAVNSFGVGGSNVHVVLEEAPANPTKESVPDRTFHLLALSGTSENALDKQLAAWKLHFETAEPRLIADECFSANDGRRHHPFRAAAVVGGDQPPSQYLDHIVSGIAPSGRYDETGKTLANRSAFLFSGQGAQYPTMFQGLHRVSPVFRTAFDKCARILDDMLPRPLDQVVFSGEVKDRNHEIHQTGFTQPALFAVQYSLYELWKSWGIVGDVLMGHSVGEIAAYCVGGGCSLEDALRLVSARGQLMQSLPAGGAMCSVALDRDNVYAALNGHESRVAIAAMNGPADTVISGTGDAVTAVAAKLEKQGVKTTLLSVSHAFHSSLMDPMLKEFERVLETLDLGNPSTMIVSTATGKLIQEEMSTSRYWLDQARNSVQFVDSMTTLQDQGITHFVEIGPHPVMLAMGRQCLPELEARWLPSARRGFDDWQLILEGLGQLYADGYDVDWRAFDAPYSRDRVSTPGYQFDQQRVWIEELDSSVSSLASSTATSEFSPDGPASSLVYQLDWENIERDLIPEQTESGQWLVMVDDNTDATPLIAALAAKQIKHSVIKLAERPDHELDQLLEADGPFDRILVVNSMTHELDPSDSNIESVDRVHQIARLIASIARSATPPPRQLWLITTRAVVGVGDEAGFSPSASPLWGFARVAALECDSWWGGILDIDDWQASASQLIAEIGSPVDDDQIVFRGSKRSVPRLREFECDETNAFESSGLEMDSGAFIITGGLGGLGTRLANWLADQGATHLILSSRSGIAPGTSADAISNLQSKGIRVDVVAADVSTQEGVQRCLDMANDTQLIGVFHAAGVDLISPISETTRADIDSLWAAKVKGAWLLHEACRDKPLRWFVCFSSIASIWGSSGRSLYAAANSFLDALAHYRRQQGLHALTVNFGPWMGGGMANDEAISELERIGNYGLPPCKTLDVLAGLLKLDTTQAVVANINWPRFRDIIESRRPRPMLCELGNTTVESSSVGTSENEDAHWVSVLRETPEESRQDKLQTLVRAAVAQVLRISDSQSIPADRNLFELGLDSLTSVELSNGLRINAAINKNDVRLLEDPSINRIVDKLHPWLESAISSSVADITQNIQKSEWLNELNITDAIEIVPRLVKLLAKELTASVKKRLTNVSPTASFSELGLDSLGSVDFANRIKSKLNLKRPPRVLEFGSLEQLATHLVEGLPAPSSSSEMVLYHPELDEKVFRFCESAWPERRKDWIAARWRWMFVDSAARLSVAPQVWLFQDEEEIVGHHGAQFVRFKSGNEERTTAWLVETMVLEDYRERGIGARLVMQSREDMPFNLSLGQTEEMRTILKRVGWTQVAPLETYMLLLKPGNVLRQKLPRPVAPLASAWFQLRQGARRLVNTSSASNTSAREIDHFDDRYDQLWKSVSKCYGCTVVRDASYLNWKYVDQPGQSFHRIEITSGDELIGCAILLVVEPDDAYAYRRAFIVDIVTSTTPNNLHAVISAAVQQGKRLGGDAMFMHLISHPIQQALENIGFLKRNPTRFLVVSLDNSVDHEKLLDPSQWLLTQGDSDIDRPW